MTVDLVLEALDNAVAAQNPAPGLIVHTDLGSQYTSEVFGGLKYLIEKDARMTMHASNHFTQHSKKKKRTRYDRFETALVALEG